MVIASSYTKEDAYYVFNFEDGKAYYPLTSIILVDDDSGLISVKNVASRKVLFLVRKS